jgi:hypothetical protein
VRRVCTGRCTDIGTTTPVVCCLLRWLLTTRQLQSDDEEGEEGSPGEFDSFIVSGDVEDGEADSTEGEPEGDGDGEENPHGARRSGSRRVRASPFEALTYA